MQASELFELAGLAVQAFAPGEEAIEFVRDNLDQVACIFTDLKLEGTTDGLEVVRYVLEALPSVPWC
ncbi:hypothetical protein M8523_31035 [Hyphomicrobiales bacterium BP6-180914]|uniref:Response regulatory domain-containing protein n=2 Tax=Lichenifustis flavocetrariae TaxID=2949735 RepID=A0AA41Z3J3_9HYPH|nr:hypothetical protein [Lichenifustis flavocetrariae]